MDIVVGKKGGFCYGVKNAIDYAKKTLENSQEPIYCLGELVHNQTVIDDLQKKGVVFIENIEQAKGKTIVRAHGIPKEVYEKAKENQIALLDCTCPNVLKIHRLAEEYSKQGYYLFLIGKKEHPEVVGTFSFCGKNARILSEVQEVKEAVQQFEKSNTNKICVLSQTTYHLKKVQAIVDEIKKHLKEDNILEIKNTICSATEERQKEAETISKQVEYMIVVGDKKSSNTTKLYEIACEHCKNVIFVDDEKQINQAEIANYEKIGIVAGASTPPELLNNIVESLQKMKGE